MPGRPPRERPLRPVLYSPASRGKLPSPSGEGCSENLSVHPSTKAGQLQGSHYHTDMGRRLLASGSVDTRLSDFEVLRAAGIDIAGPVDRPREPTQLEELHWLFEGALRHSDDAFMVMPEMENSNLLGGHWDLLFSHPVYYVDERSPGTPLVTEHPEYGRMYNIGSVEDMMTMIEVEDMPRLNASPPYERLYRLSRCRCGYGPFPERPLPWSGLALGHGLRLV